MKLRLACVVVILVFLQGFACAVGKSTVDPNAKAALRDAVGPDTSQHVTYDAKRKMVVSILADLSKMTGVTLKAGYNDDDWQVRDRRMNIFVKDVPLSDLMNSIARVMKFQWSKREDGDVVSYRLYMDRKVVLGAECKRLAEEERIRQRQARARERLLSGLEEAATMSDGELERLKDASPYVYSLVKGEGSHLLDLCKRSGVREAWLSGEEWTGNYLDLADADERQYPEVGFAGGKMKVRGVLDRLESDCRDNWVRRDRMLEIHSRDWYRKRTAQIPDARLHAWREALMTKGTLSLEELSQIAALTPEQLTVNIDQDEVLGSSGIYQSLIVSDNRDLLALYAALDSRQRESLFTDQGLSLELLADGSSTAARRIKGECSASGGKLCLAGRLEKRDGSECYTFKIIDSSGKLAGPWWMVRCPKYKTASGASICE